MKPLNFAQLAESAYTDTPTMGQIGSAGIAVQYGNVLAFRGSSDVASWLHDLDVGTYEVPGIGDVHGGFWSAYLEIRADVLATKPDFVTGHSLGAALAIIAAADLQLHGWQLAGVYAFEPPKVSTDNALAMLLQPLSPKLYKNGNDIVPEMPLTLPIEDWQHCAPLIQIGKPAEPFPNITDHEISRVVAALHAPSIQTLMVRNLG